jgi:hypothetical protein
MLSTTPWCLSDVLLGPPAVQLRKTTPTCYAQDLKADFALEHLAEYEKKRSNVQADAQCSDPPWSSSTGSPESAGVRRLTEKAAYVPVLIIRSSSCALRSLCKFR